MGRSEPGGGRIPKPPPAQLGPVPGDASPSATNVGDSVLAVADVRSIAYLRTRTPVPAASRPLTSTSAPLVVLVVATRTPEDGASLNGVKLEISRNTTLVSCWSGLFR